MTIRAHAYVYGYVVGGLCKDLVKNMTVNGTKFSSGLLQKIWHYSELPQTAVSLRQMCQFGSHPTPGLMFKASCFTLQELPIRLAHRIKELDSLPNGLNRMPDVIQVRNWYTQSFKELYEFATDTSTQNGKLYQMLYGGIQPNFKEKESLDRIIDLLYTDPELGIVSNSTSIVHKHRNSTFVDDGLVMKTSKPASKKQSSVLQEHHRPGLPLLPKKYYAPLPTRTMSQLNKNPDYYTFWPKEILTFNSRLFDVLNTIKQRHDATVITLAKGVLKWRKTHQQNVVDDSIQSFLDRFYLSRIGIRMLIGQHLALLSKAKEPYSIVEEEDQDYVGVICTRTNITQLSQDAIDSARYICAEYYGLFEAPKVDLLCFPLDHSMTSAQLLEVGDDVVPDIEFMYVPGHLIHMLFETLKNALRATVEKIISKHPNTDIYDLHFPAVKVIISEGLEDLTVKISDEGGGIARSNLPLVWTYLYTTMPDDEQIGLIDEGQNADASNVRVPMAGYGYGLALSRLYARYFGGDLKLISMEGFGTDVYLHLNRLSTSSEPLQ